MEKKEEKTMLVARILMAVAFLAMTAVVVYVLQKTSLNKQEAILLFVTLGLFELAFLFFHPLIFAIHFVSWGLAALYFKLVDSKIEKSWRIFPAHILLTIGAIAIIICLVEVVAGRMF